MVYTVNPMKNINYGATGVEEILQNVAFILSTFKMSCPLDREFGYDPPLDVPINVGITLSATRIVEAINQFEPRAEVIDVEVTGDPMRGKVIPKVRVTINAEQI